MNEPPRDADESLLRRCQRGDERALAELIRRYQDRINRLACRTLADPSLAEEATAATLVKIWSKCGQWRAESSAGTWIYRIAVRTILDTRRSQGRWWRRWGRPLDEGASSVEPADSVDQREERAKHTASIEAALQALSPEDRALVHLFYFENQSLTEIASILDAGRDALKMRLMRVREKLRERLRGLDASE